MVCHIQEAPSLLRHPHLSGVILQAHSIEWIVFREELKEGGLHSTPGLTKRGADSLQERGRD